MRTNSLGTKLILAMTVLVTVSGALISQIITRRYSESLFQTAAAQAENIAHNLALIAAEPILIYDLVTVQKLLDDQMRSHPSVAYLFVMKDNDVIAHTFPEGVPLQLFDANRPFINNQGHLSKIRSETGEGYIDVAWPIFEGKAGVLRLGFSELSVRQKISRLQLEIAAVTFGILVAVLLLGHLLIRRITRPLIQLSEAAERINQNNLEIDLRIVGKDEVARLGYSFKKMLQRIQNHTLQLETKNEELSRAYQQTRTTLEIIRQISSLTGLEDIAQYLIYNLRAMISCQHFGLIFFGSDSKTLYFSFRNTFRTINEGPVEAVIDRLGGPGEGPVQVDPALLPIQAGGWPASMKKTLLPIRHEGQIIGAMVAACPDQCLCLSENMGVVQMLLNQIAGTIRRAVLYFEEVGRLRNQLSGTLEYHGIVGKSPQMQVIYQLIEDVAPADATILIQGESGTGKELVARAIHRRSPRNTKPFVVVNCSAYPETLLESELFGHEKGAFTGAHRRKIGRFEQADGGVVFLDEIGEISASAQVKLLRILQSRTFERVGGEPSMTVDVRILAATNRDLLQEVKDGRFREDLYYRLKVIPIRLPPLRDRRNDIPLLARHFLRRFSLESEKLVSDFSSEAMRRLIDYPWPGNVRELENSIEHAVVLAKSDTIEVSDLPSALLFDNAGTMLIPDARREVLQATERQMLIDALNACNWNKKAAARRLSMGRSTLYNKMKKYEITPEDASR